MPCSLSFLFFFLNSRFCKRYNTKHGHGHLLAGVLYVANTSGCKEDPDGGWLEFFDPRRCLFERNDFEEILLIGADLCEAF